MATTTTTANGSDSEEDPDYVPDNGGGKTFIPLNTKYHRLSLLDASDDERDTKRRRTGEVVPDTSFQDDEAARKQARDKAWADLQASSPSSSTSGPSQSKNMVKILKTHRFAGEDVSEVMTVFEDSEDAKKWPLWESSSHLSVPQTPIIPEMPAADSSPTPPPALVAPLKKQVRRKPRVQLGDIPSASSQKTKKLTTIEKSAMDWKAHSLDDAQLKDELDANRRGGGYLEKVQFLNDVGDRRDKLLEESKDKKRRRG